MFKRSGSRWLAGVCTATLLAAGGVAHAAATDNMMPTANYDVACFSGTLGSGFCQTDDSALSIFRQASITTTGRSNIASNLNSQFAATDLSTQYPSTPVYSGTGQTDVIYQQNSNVPSGFDGITWCEADGTGVYKCDQHYVGFRSGTPYTALVCHETGHAVGLTHGNNASPQVTSTNSIILGCMVTGSIPTSSLGANNVENINATY